MSKWMKPLAIFVTFGLISVLTFVVIINLLFYTTPLVVYFMARTESDPVAMNVGLYATAAVISALIMAVVYRIYRRFA